MTKLLFASRLPKPFFYFLLTSITFLISTNAQAEWIPFKIVDGAIVIDIELAGRPATAMLDTGATINMIDSDFVEQFGQEFSKLRKIEASGVNDNSELWLYGGIPAVLFGNDLKLSNVGAANLEKADLLLGGGFLKQSIIQIDYPQSRLQLLGKKAVDMKKHANVPMKSARGSLLPAVEVELDGNKAWLIFDTGTHSGIYLQRDFAMDKGLLRGDTPVEAREIQGINKAAKTDRFAVGTVKLGPYLLDNVAVDVPSEGETTNLNPNVYETKIGTRIKRTINTKGRLGYEILKDFVITLDYSGFKVNIYAP